MCRLLAVRSPNQCKISEHLHQFAKVAENSVEYQGHGWGCAYLVQGEWRHYKNIKPIWDDDLDQFGTTELLIAHARSAFQDEGIVVENNMPFYNDKYVFIFNGELRGVSIKEKGRIGAEKIFNYINRFDKGSIADALVKGVNIIKKRTEKLRAMNIIMTDKHKIYVSSSFTKDDEYFTMRTLMENGELIICSEPYPDGNGWQAIPNNSFSVY